MGKARTTRSSPECPKCGCLRDRKVLKNGAKAGDMYWYCPACSAARTRAWRLNNPERERYNRVVSLERERQKDADDPSRSRSRSLRKKYKMSLDEYESLLRAQGGLCAVCRTDAPGGPGNILHVDHDHSCCSQRYTCGKCVRGLLCHRCNQALGLMNDDVSLIKGLVEYLEKAAKA